MFLTYEIPDKWFGNFSALRSDRNWTAVRNEEKFLVYGIKKEGATHQFFDSRLYEKYLIDYQAAPNTVEEM